MDEFLMPGIAPEKLRVWDEYVPIIKQGRDTRVYLADHIEAPSAYNETCFLLDNAIKYDNIAFHVNNGGGYVDSGVMLIDAVERTKATTIAKLSGTVASIATVFVLACDKIEIADHTSFMIHNYSGGVQGKGGEMKSQMEFMSAELAITFRKVYAGFLTPDEIEAVIDDKDMWLNKTEVLARWDARKRKDAEGLEEIAAERKARMK